MVRKRSAKRLRKTKRETPPRKPPAPLTPEEQALRAEHREEQKRLRQEQERELADFRREGREEARRKRAAREAARRRAAAEATPTPPPRRETPRPGTTVRRGRVVEDFVSHYTLWRAAGSSGRRLGAPEDPFGIYQFVDDPPPGMISGPGSFYSQAGPDFGGLGAIRFDGYRSVEEMVEMQNDTLQIYDEAGNGPVDFRVAYPTWSARIVVVEQVLGGGDKIVSDQVADNRDRRFRERISR